MFITARQPMTCKRSPVLIGPGALKRTRSLSKNSEAYLRDSSVGRAPGPYPECRWFKSSSRNHVQKRRRLKPDPRGHAGRESAQPSNASTKAKCPQMRNVFIGKSSIAAAERPGSSDVRTVEGLPMQMNSQAQVIMGGRHPQAPEIDTSASRDERRPSASNLKRPRIDR